MLDWQSLEECCSSCCRCGLSGGRTNVVFGVGCKEADVMFIGEGPGEQEDLKGEPFVGPAGHLLDDMMAIIDLNRENVYIANIVKCRPPGNRDPYDEEQGACVEYLRNQVSLVKPKSLFVLAGLPPKELSTRSIGLQKNTVNGFNGAAFG